MKVIIGSISSFFSFFWVLNVFLLISRGSSSFFASNGPHMWAHENQDANCPFHPIPVDIPKPIPSILQDAFSQVEDILKQKLQDAKGATCFSSAIVYRDEIIHQFSYGAKNKSQPNSTPDETTIYRIGSVTKLFPTLMLFQFQEKGFVSLSDAIQKVAPDFSIINPFSASPGITFQEIVSQMSGLPREAPCIIPCNVTTQDIFDRLSKETLILPPWTKPSYSNLGFSLVGRILENIAGMRFEDYVDTFILKPLGMTSSGFSFTPNVQAQMAVGYEPDGSVAPLFDFGWNSPCGQMYSNINDLSSLIKLFIRAYNMSETTPVLGNNLLKQMLSPVFINPDGNTLFGSPWEIRFQHSYQVRRKGGNVDGYTALVAVIPELSLGFSILLNGQISEFEISNAVFDVLIPAFVSALQPLQPAYVLPPNPQMYEGKYEASGIPARVLTYQGKLLFQCTILGSFYLKWEKENTFRIYIPDVDLPCLENELIAYNDEYVYFGTDNSGTVNSVFIPGLAYALHFQKISKI